MATYRNILPKFWSDAKVKDSFTPEDKYFYLYLLTNESTNLLGCYELSLKKASEDTGYNNDTINHLLDRMIKIHKTIEYSHETKELLLINWSKHNWSKSPKLDPAIVKFLDGVKNQDFRRYLADIYNKRDTVSIPYEYGIDTTISISITNTSTKKGIVKGKNLFDEYTRNPQLLEALNEFKKMRTKTKATLTEHGIKLLLSKLDKLATSDADKIEIINQSILNGWKGLFPLNDTKLKSKQHAALMPTFSKDTSIDEDVDELRKKLKRDFASEKERE